MIKSNKFIQAMNSNCKMMDAFVVINGVTYSADNILSLNPRYEGSLLCSVMKCCDIEIQFDEDIDSSMATALKGKSVSSVKIGAKEETDEEFSYIEYGKYKVYSAEYREETNSVFLTCYDSMLDAMIPYNIEFKGATTVKVYLQTICNTLGWKLANVQFANESAKLEADTVNSYLSQSDSEEHASKSDFTYRDALDDIAEAIGGNLIFKNDGMLYPLYPTVATDENEAVILSVDNQQTLSFEEQFGPINSVALVNGESADAVVLDNSSSIKENGECQITIKDNPLMKANRSAFINGIFNKLYGLYYVPFEFTSFGFGYMEFGDMFDLEDKKGNLKRAIMLNDNFLLSLSVQETASAKKNSADSETEYSVSTPMDKAIKKVVTEVKSLQDASTDLSKRIADATESITKAKDGHAVAVDLECDEKTKKYYIGNGAPNTFIASLNPATATETEPIDWNSGRLIRINHNGFAVSTNGIAGPYQDFAVYYNEKLGKYCTNADDIGVGTLQGIKAILEEGIIGGFTIGTWTDKDGNKHNGLKKTFSVGGGYTTFALDGTSGSQSTDYLIQLFPSDENGNSVKTEHTFCVSKEGNGEFNDIVANRLYLNGDIERIAKVWEPLTLLNGATPGSYGGRTIPSYIKIDNHVYIEGSINLSIPASGSVQLATLPVGFRPKANVYAYGVCGGQNVSRIFVSSSGVLYLEWAVKISDGARYSGNSWVQVKLDYFVD